jgi:3'(2'), 5'-bisphosphate nucleotidase
VSWQCSSPPACTSHNDGSPLRYNRRDPWLPDLLVCLPELADAVLSAVSAG